MLAGIKLYIYIGKWVQDRKFFLISRVLYSPITDTLILICIIAPQRIFSHEVGIMIECIISYHHTRTCQYSVCPWFIFILRFRIYELITYSPSQRPLRALYVFIQLVHYCSGSSVFPGDIKLSPESMWSNHYLGLVSITLIWHLHTYNYKHISKGSTCQNRPYCSDIT